MSKSYTYEQNKQDFFSKLADKHLGTYVSQTDSWFNGHTYMPLNRHIVEFNFEDWCIHILYEHKMSKYTKANFFNTGANADIKQWLLGCQKLIEIFNNGKIKSEFDPEILGYVEKGKYTVQINYATATMDLESIDQFELFLKQVVQQIR